MARKKQSHNDLPEQEPGRRPEAPEEEAEAADDGEAAAASKEQGAPAVEEAERPIAIVGIGASAGGLEAFESFFTHMPPDTGMAFVLVQHLSPTHESGLVDLIRRRTRMEVLLVEHEMPVRPNRVYVIPPNKDLGILHGALQLIDPPTPRDRRLPIDFFFRSLAQDQGEQAIGIVLSGTASDGTLGVKAIKGEGGMVIVQEPGSAKYDSMPASALATGLADYVLAPEEMPRMLIEYLKHAPGRGLPRVAGVSPVQADHLRRIFSLLHTKTGHDFSRYKEHTIGRRIERRMAIHQIERITDYIRFLGENSQEVDALFKELLIGVTSFFRDPPIWKSLAQKVVPRMFEGRRPDDPIRVWVPGCSTGEEAYSLAILLTEQMEALQRDYDVQVFATDIDPQSIELARQGVYPDNITADVSPGRLERFFTQEDDHYRISKPIRDIVIFAEQSLIKDPPFSRLDLISCRNLLIYMKPELQDKVVPLLHYALRPGGILFLGTSETLSKFAYLFEPVDRRSKLFRRAEGHTPLHAMVNFQMPPAEVSPVEGGRGAGRVSLAEVVEKTLMDQYVPAMMVVNERSEILYLRGPVRRYLDPVDGEASLNLHRMLRAELRLPLASAMRQAATEKRDVVYENLRIESNGERRIVRLTVKPVSEPPSMQGLMLAVLEDMTPTQHALRADQSPAGEEQDRQALEMELRSTREYLQTLLEEVEAANEELKSTNEELQSANEELQSTNEELETSREEIQSVNEELVTVNAELENKIDELTQANNDLENLLTNIKIGVIFLNSELRVRRFNPAAAKIANLIETDVGRPISHIVSNLKYDRLLQDAQEVFDTLNPKNLEARTDQGRWYLIQIRPYRTVDHAIDGVVVTFTEITEQKATQRALQEARLLAESVVATVREPLVVLDAELRVVSANPAFYLTFHVAPEQTQGELLYELGNRQWDIPQLRALLEKVVGTDTQFEAFEVEHDFPAIGRCKMLLNARRIEGDDGRPHLILLAMEEVGEKA